MGPSPKHMVEVYEWAIDQWLEDSPLTQRQEMILKHGGKSFEEMLRTDLERLQYWKLMAANSGT